MSGEQAAIGMTLIAAERKRQIDIEGYTPEHDAAHGGFVLSQAAHCYEAWGWVGRLGGLPDQWPWGRDAWKPRDPISNLVRAGALFMASHEQGYPTALNSAQRCAASIDTSAAVLAALATATPARLKVVAAHTGRGGGEMSEYARIPSGVGGEFSVCNACGAMVLDEARHDGFHDELTTAVGGDQVAGDLDSHDDPPRRPLGPPHGG